MSWIGVDLDGTLAEYHGWVSEWHIGPPIPAMIERVQGWLAAGKDVRIFTARVSPVSLAVNGVDPGEVDLFIKRWCGEHLGRPLPVTHEKDLHMIELWDDRCVEVTTNSGQPTVAYYKGEVQRLTDLIHAGQRSQLQLETKLREANRRIAQLGGEAARV